ncbi:hypothetical protein AJ85_14970 [Alkalihalobacillus alcalophilus ATCC 27647 = CGMCC 1.3604]|uniref:Uncharacterized protein n=1 Tax=Alkalihalobacillus alcalophilus ATCC 27647 = CGMCC 1.3604 TaxID=1218173 RepID=A0A4S4JX81_ALKAL|nr:hypothetical protein AJ85_14970 [Alkalihalobacillus alcalophilus ATCC 27647 = CGMCC 1.3604]
MKCKDRVKKLLIFSFCIKLSMQNKKFLVKEMIIRGYLGLIYRRESNKKCSLKDMTIN